ncbi:MAG: oligosaccharide flippase family protein [Candidatus Coproplasma sp.]
MSKAKSSSLKINVIFSFISQIITYLIPFIVAPYVSRVLTPSGTGEYSYGYSIVYYFSLITIFGFTNYATRQIAAKRDNKNDYSEVFWNTFWLRGAFFIVSCTIYAILVLTKIFPDSVQQGVYLALIICLIGDLFDITYLYQGLERFRLFSVFNIIANLIYLVLVFIFVKDISDLVIYTALKSSVKVILSLFLWGGSFKYINRPTFSIRIIWDVLKGSSLFFLPSLVMHIGPMVDQTMIGALANNAEVGYYQQVYKIITLVCSLIYALGPIMLSKMSYLFATNDNTQIVDKMSKLIRTAFLIMFPAILGLYCIASNFIPAYFGEEYIPAVQVMYWFLPGILFSSLSSLLINGYYYSSKRVFTCTLIMGCSVVLNIVTNIFAIQYLGATGAAITSTACGLLSVVLLILFSKKELNYLKIFKGTWKPLLAALIMAGVLIGFNFLWTYKGLNNDIIITIIDIAIGATVYLIGLCVLKEEIVMLIFRSVFKRKRKEEQSNKNT